MQTLSQAMTDLPEAQRVLAEAKTPGGSLGPQPTAKASEVEQDDDPRNKPAYTFQLDYTDTRGFRWAGTFTSNILTIGQRQQVGIIRARLAAGLDASKLDAETTLLNEALATLTMALSAQPEWAQDLLSLTDPDIIYLIYGKVLDHENYFFRRGSAEASSSQPGE